MMADRDSQRSLESQDPFPNSPPRFIFPILDDPSPERYHYHNNMIRPNSRASRPDSRASAVTSELDESTYDMLSDTTTDDGALTAESLASDSEGFEENESTRAVYDYEDSSDGESTEDERDDHGDTLVEGDSLDSLLTERPSHNAGPATAPVDFRELDAQTKLRILRDFERRWGVKPTDDSKVKQSNKPLRSDQFRILGATFDIRTILLFVLTFPLVVIWAHKLMPDTTTSVHTKEYEQFLRSNLPSLATATPSSAISTSNAPANTEPAIESSKFMDGLSLSSMSKVAFSWSSKGSATEDEKDSTKSQSALPKASTQNAYKAVSEIKVPTNVNINTRTKGNTESASNQKAYIYLKSGVIVPYTSGPKPSNRPDRLGPYTELTEGQQMFNLSYSMSAKQFNLTSSRQFKGSLAILISQKDRLLMRGHKPNMTASIEWVPSEFQLDNNTPYNVTIVIPAEAKFQRTIIDFQDTLSPLFAVAVRLTSALTTYVEPIQNTLTAKTQKIDKLISTVENNIEKSVSLAQGSAMILASRLQNRMSSALTTITNRHVGIGDAFVRVRTQSVKGLIHVGYNTRYVIGTAQRRVKTIAKNLKQRRAGAIGVKQCGRGRLEGRSSKKNEKKASRLRWMEQIL